MGSTTSLSQQRTCGLCTKSFDYKKALEILKKSINQYEDSLHKNIGQFKQKDQKILKQDFNQVKQQVLNYLKNDQQLKARKLLIDFFNQQKQPKLITREIDFLDKKQKMLQLLRKNIDTSVKPYKTQERRKQIIQFDRQLQSIKELKFNPHEDQKSGDSGDVQAYIDRIMDELKSKIPVPKVQSVISEKKASPIPQREPSGEEYREKFLRKLRAYKTGNGERLRRLTQEETGFFKRSLGIELTEGGPSSMMRKSKDGSRRKVWYGGQQGKQGILNDGEDIPSVSEISDPSQMRVDSRSRGYYLNCNGFEVFDMQELVKSDWQMVEVLDLQQCGISSHWWKIFANNQRRCLPNLKVVYFGLNQIVQVNLNQLEMLRGVEYLSFGWWNESNLLSDESKRVIGQFQSKHAEIKIQFPLQ